MIMKAKYVNGCSLKICKLGGGLPPLKSVFLKGEMLSKCSKNVFDVLEIDAETIIYRGLRFR